jgi:gas vesicle protein
MRYEHETRYAREHDGGRVALAALTGAMVGVGVALLFAPKSGTALRNDIGESVGSLRQAVGDRYRSLTDRATSLVEQVNGTAGRAVAALELGAKHYAKLGERPRHVPVSAGD